MAWLDNSAMFWNDGTKFQKITDHNRQPLAVSIERIEKKQRMANGTLRRYSVAKKRTWTTSWNLVPSTNTKSNGLKTADGGWAGEDIENFHNSTDGSFQMQLRKGDGTIETVTVMISDFSKDIANRGIVDLWNMSITLQEV